jgi:hypothetical protein
MQVVFKVKTPKGQAQGTNDKIKKFIIGFNKVKVETYVNDENSEIVWMVTGQLKYVMRVQANIARFDALIKNIFEHNLMKKFTGEKLSKEDVEELREMLENQTSVEIVRKATQEERDEYSSTWLDRVRNLWKRNKIDS